MNNLLITSTELAELLHINKRQASKLINEVNKELEQKGIYVFHTKPARAPRKTVLERIGL